MKNHERFCKRCKKSFILKNIAYEKRGGGVFCSRTCSSRKLYLNEHFFDIIDTEEKSYWLGFLYADGSNAGDHFSICLNIDDKSHLERFKNAIEAEHKVKSIIKTNFKKGVAAFLQISSKKMCNSLTQQGCVKNKTFVVKMPHLAKELQRHFIRGVFDGDGTIGIMNKKYLYKKWSIYSASKDFAESIHEVLINNGISSNLYERHYKDNRKPGFNICVHKQQEIQKLYNYLYDDAHIFLQRKNIKFL